LFTTSAAGAPAPKARSWRWRLLRLAAIAVCTYLGFLVFLVLMEDRLVFHAKDCGNAWAPPTGAGFRDIDLSTADGTRLHAWWCPYENAHGAILHCHGSGGDLSHWGPRALELQEQLHESVLLFDYPGYGRSEGEPSEAGCYAAADAAFDWLTQTQSVPAEQVVLYGESLGGGVAVELAHRRPHRALVLVKTFTSIPDVAQQRFPLAPARWLAHNHFDNLAKVKDCTRPVFIAHGTTDTFVPFALGRRLFDAANEPKQFVAVEGKDHNEPLESGFLGDLRQFLATKAAVP
jgi:fermentation-respiration switch protein FrsA (DUF1100 family)